MVKQHFPNVDPWLSFQNVEEKVRVVISTNITCIFILLKANLFGRNFELLPF